MRKIIVACCLFAVSMGTFAGSRIPLYPRQYPPVLKGNGPRRMPSRPLTVELEDYTLSFGYGFDEAVTVELLNEDENVVYTDWLAPGQTTLTFPTSLTGEYTIRLTVGSICYIGFLMLGNS